MKKIIIYTITILLGVHVYAQCTQDASTDPANPVNNDLTPIMKTGQNAVNEFKNTFDWGAHSNTSFHSIPLNLDANWSLGSHGGLMHSPFSTNMPSGYSYLHQGGALPDDCDWHWEDGWELMWTHLGNYPNGEGVETTNPNRIIAGQNGLANPNTPYFVLYNRYSGKLRFFGNMFQEINATNNDHIQLFLRHDPPNDQAPVSGVFRHVSGYDRPLDQSTINTFISSNNKSPGNNNAWFSSDFQLGFDPCVCDNPTLWELEYQLITQWDVKLYGREVNKELPVNKFDGDYLSNTSIDATGSSGGTLLYKSFDGLYTNYLAEMDAYNQKMATYNRPANAILRSIVSKSADLSTKAANFVLPSAAVTSFVSDFMTPIYPHFSTQNAEWMARGIKKAGDAQLARGLDFLVKETINPDALTEPDKPTMPTATFAESRIGGDIARNNRIALTGLYNPGSFKPNVNQITPYNYPLWNKPVGLFAMLRTPHLKLYHNQNATGVWGNFSDDYSGYSKWFNFIPGDIEHGLDNEYGYMSQKQHRIQNIAKICEYKYEQDINFKIGEKLFYKFNDNLDFDKDLTNTRYSIQITLESEAGDDLYWDETGFGFNKFQTLDVSKSNLEVFRHLRKTADQNEQVTLVTEWLNMKDAQEQNFGGRIRSAAKFQVQEGTVTYVKFHSSTKGGMVHLEPVFEFGTPWPNVVNTSGGQLVVKPEVVDFLKFKIKKVVLKVMPDMYFKQVGSNGGKVNTTQVFSYLLFDNDKGVDLIASHGQWLDEGNRKSQAQKYLPYTLVLDNETITTTSDYVNSVVAGTIVVNAQEIEVKNGLTVQPGFALTLNAVDNISVTNTSVSPVVSFNIRKNYYGLGQISETTQAEVDAFCSGGNKEYSADVAANSPIGQKDTDPIDSEDFDQRIDVFPNPSSGKVTFKFLKGFAEGAFILTDLNGRKILNEKLSLELTQTFDLSNLSDGLYIVKISTDNEVHTQKLILRKN